MVSIRISKLIHSLAQKKNRDELGMFIAEGPKLVQDLASSFHCKILLYTPEFKEIADMFKSEECIELTPEALRKVSSQQHPQGVLAVFGKPSYSYDFTAMSNSLSVALDNVQDPGNLGTIIRIADWFGIKDVFCSEFTADAFSPKAVQASMGALARVKIHTVTLHSFLVECKKHLPLYGTFMDGENIYTKTLTKQGVIIMGNEGQGISESIGKLVSERLLIPNYPKGELSSESLNVGVATALVCAEFRRRV